MSIGPSNASQVTLSHGESGPTKIWHCVGNCGFIGAYGVVEQHEEECVNVLAMPALSDIQPETESDDISSDEEEIVFNPRHRGRGTTRPRAYSTPVVTTVSSGNPASHQLFGATEQTVSVEASQASQSERPRHLEPRCHICRANGKGVHPQATKAHLAGNKHQKAVDLLKEPLQKKEHGESVGLCVTPISSDSRRDSFKDYRGQMERVEAGHELMWDAPLPTRKQPCVGDYFIFWFYKEKIIVHRITDIRTPTSRPANWTTPGHADRKVVYLSPECCRMDWATFQEANGYKRCMGTVCAAPNRLSTILPAIEHALSEVPVA